MDKDRMGRARNARINQAVAHATELLVVLRKLSGFPKNEHVDLKDEWWDGRNKLEQLVQCFHEANAYNNAFTGDPAHLKPLVRRGEGEAASDPVLGAGSPVQERVAQMLSSTSAIYVAAIIGAAVGIAIGYSLVPL